MSTEGDNLSISNSSAIANASVKPTVQETKYWMSHLVGLLTEQDEVCQV